MNSNQKVQVGFHSDKLVKKAQVARRLNEIVNRLNKTQVCCCRGMRAAESLGLTFCAPHQSSVLAQVERFPDLAAEKAAFEKEQAGKRKAEAAVSWA